MTVFLQKMDGVAWEAEKTGQVVMIAILWEMCWTASGDQKHRVAGDMTGGSEKLSVVDLGESGCSKAIWVGRNFFVHISFSR